MLVLSSFSLLYILQRMFVFDTSEVPRRTRSRFELFYYAYTYLYIHTKEKAENCLFWKFFEELIIIKNEWRPGEITTGRRGGWSSDNNVCLTNWFSITGWRGWSHYVATWPCHKRTLLPKSLARLQWRKPRFFVLASVNDISIIIRVNYK